MERNRILAPTKVQSSLVLILSILIGFALITSWLDLLSIEDGSWLSHFGFVNSRPVYSSDFNCSLKCSDMSLFSTTTMISKSAKECPEYFRWIHEDLKPWKEIGITEEIVERGKTVAHMRITIVRGRLYVVKYKRAFQTRDAITIWGLLQLLRLYPGRVPDLDLMFECGDRPVIPKHGLNASVPLPIFHYCSDDLSFDIAFPDWSFWGWPEVNIKPWVELKEELKEANKRIEWNNREPYAYWKGNTRVGIARRDLLKCNASNGPDRKARIYNKEWAEASKQGFNNSDLAKQCTHRYKIYVEGVTWSVSQKYILACDSMALVIKPHYYNFFTRSLLPLVHYWPIQEKKKCESIKFAVEWGNKHTSKAQKIGRAGSSFVQESLAMKNVYDYSFHVLSEYAKLLKYKPTIPEGAVETCLETFVCPTKGRKKRFLKRTMVQSTSDTPPCTLPPPYKLDALLNLVKKKENITRQVMSWEESESKST